SSHVTGNIAQGGAEAAGPGGYAVGGGITNSPTATMLMTNCVVTGNKAIGGHGGPGAGSLGAGQHAGFGFGGGIDVSNSGPRGTGGLVGAGHGGGVAAQVGSTFAADLNTIIKHNHASTSGDDFFSEP